MYFCKVDGSEVREVATSSSSVQWDAKAQNIFTKRAQCLWKRLLVKELSSVEIVQQQ